MTPIPFIYYIMQKVHGESRVTENLTVHMSKFKKNEP